MTSSHTEELAVLFDPEKPLLPFSLDSVRQIPEFGSILYAVFLDKTEFIYIGTGGLSGANAKSRRPTQSNSSTHSAQTK